MNIKEYIESGIIESYVLGATTPEENEEIEQLAQQYPEIQLEIEANKVALIEYIMQFEEEPPAALKDKVLDKLAHLETQNQQDEIEHQIYQIDSDTRRINPWMPYLAAASVVLLFVSLGFNVFLYSNWKNTQLELNNLEAQNHQLLVDSKVLNTKYEETSEGIGHFNQPSKYLCRA